MGNEPEMNVVPEFGPMQNYTSRIQRPMAEIGRVDTRNMEPAFHKMASLIPCIQRLIMAILRNVID